MLEAQQKVVTLQEKQGIIDPVSETGALMAQISGFETEMQKKNLELQQLLDNAKPNQARVDGVRGDIQRLSDLVASLRSQISNSGNSTDSLARVTSELRMAEVELQTRQVMMTQALQSLETSRVEANRQVRYLSIGVSPVAPDEPTYPRAFENTLVAFLIFAGLYLLMSLTASILREQVSS
jgi:capsular polysaccharide transport system permease protein